MEKNCVRFEKYNFLIFGKGEKQKNFVGFFKICKYTFLIFEKGDKGKKCGRICKYTFFNI